jgi:hypothetical protein
MLTGVEVLPSLGESDFQDKNETVKEFRHYIFAIINRTRDSPNRFQKSKGVFEKENRPSPAARSTDKDRKIVGDQLI